MALGEILQRPGQIVGRKAVGRADPHVADEFEVDAGDFALGVEEGAFHFLGRAEEAVARRGQRRARRAPLEQLRAERRFERRDAAADGGVVEPQALRRSDELPGAGDGEKDPDVVPVHDGLFEDAPFGAGLMTRPTARAPSDRGLIWRNSALTYPGVANAVQRPRVRHNDLVTQPLEIS